MISPERFVRLLENSGITSYFGVPDSTLKHMCSYVTAKLAVEKHLICVNEGAAMASAIGYHLSTGEVPVVYMQNSGFGNAINPVTSLAAKDVYSIPALLVIGWRGEPGKKDEPQHVFQGKITEKMCETFEIPYAILDASSSLEEIINAASAHLTSTHTPYAILVKKKTFQPFTTDDNAEQQYTITREDVVSVFAREAEKEGVIVSTTGMASRELFESLDGQINTCGAQFLTVGGMGHASSIALGVAQSRPEKNVICLDGDGAVLMHMGALATIGCSGLQNFTHVVINNGEHGSTGGQPNLARKIDLCAIAKGCGYNDIIRISQHDELKRIASEKMRGTRFVEVMVNNSYRQNLGRPTSTALENKISFMSQLGIK